MTTETPTAVGAVSQDRRRGRLLSGLLASLILALSLSIGATVVKPPPAAAVSLLTGSPIIAPPGGPIRGLPASAAIVRGAHLNPYVGGAMLLFAGVQFADSYFDLGILPDWLSLNGGQSGAGAAPNVSLLKAEVIAAADGRPYIQAAMSWAKAGDNPSYARLYVSNAECKTPGVAGVQRFYSTPSQSDSTGSITWQQAVSGEAGQTILNSGAICPAGTGLVQAWVNVRTAFGYAISNPIIGVKIRGPYGAGDYEQTATVQCRKPDGSIGTLNSSTAGRPDEIHVPSCEAAWPGSIPWNQVIKGGPQGGTPDTLLDVGTDPNILTQYPDCFANGAFNCVVRVWINGQPCTVDRELCWDWPKTLQTRPEVSVQCKMGPYVILLKNCNALKRSYSPDADPEVIVPNPNGDPDVKPPEPKPPNPNPEGPPTTGPNPQAPPTNPDVETDPDSRSCYADAWSWNPIDWVYVPVKCVMLWAFKPKVSLSTRIGSINGLLTGKAPFDWILGLPNIPIGMGGGCPQWDVKVDTPGGGGAEVDDSVVCGHGFTQAIRAARPALAGMMALLAIWPLIRGVAYASIPIFKVNPGSNQR